MLLIFKNFIFARCPIKAMAYDTKNHPGSFKNDTENAKIQTEYKLTGSGFKNDLF